MRRRQNITDDSCDDRAKPTPDHADDDENDVNANRESLLNILYPNKKGKSAFDNCLKRKSPKLTEVYLKMLIELDFIKHYRFSKFIRKHFDVLFDITASAYFARVVASVAAQCEKLPQG